MKYLSLFSGIGGFELGIQQAYEFNNKLQQRQNRKKNNIPYKKGTSSKQFKTTIRKSEPICIGFSEIDKYAIQVYNKHFNHKNYGDITKIQSNSLPDFELLVGGFPCQAFSIAGKRGGFNDTRGTLFFEIAKIIREKQPRLLLLENVKGLLSHDKGNTFFTIISTLDELGYDCQWQVLNSKDFGVPQNRERVFIIGHFRGTCRPEIFPIERTSKKNIKQINKPVHSNDRIYLENGISPTLNTAQGGNRQPFIKINKKGNKKKEQNIASTLTGGAHSGGNHSDMDLLLKDAKIRRLTPIEGERLQGFPDNWTETITVDSVDINISDTQRYKMIGNAVTVNVIKQIMLRLL